MDQATQRTPPSSSRARPPPRTCGRRRSSSSPAVAVFKLSLAQTTAGLRRRRGCRDRTPPRRRRRGRASQQATLTTIPARVDRRGPNRARNVARLPAAAAGRDERHSAPPAPTTTGRRSDGTPPTAATPRVQRRAPASLRATALRQVGVPRKEEAALAERGRGLLPWGSLFANSQPRRWPTPRALRRFVGQRPRSCSITRFMSAGQAARSADAAGRDRPYGRARRRAPMAAEPAAGGRTRQPVAVTGSAPHALAGLEVGRPARGAGPAIRPAPTAGWRGRRQAVASSEGRPVAEQTVCRRGSPRPPSRRGSRWPGSRRACRPIPCAAQLGEDATPRNRQHPAQQGGQRAEARPCVQGPARGLGPAHGISTQ